MRLQIVYYYQKPVETARHGQICDLLARLQAGGRIATFSVEDADPAFPTKEAQQPLFDKLQEFAIRHHVGLARIFGSQRRGFCYLPPQFLLVSEGDELREVFPCRIGDSQVEPLEFLERINSGQPWTVRSGVGMEGKKHKIIVTRILDHPGLLEPGLSFRNQNVQVSQDFGELGYIDLMFEDLDGRTLLVEVKVEADELDKAIGQIQRHRYLFARQNNVEESSTRIGIACPFIPDSCRAICAKAGITCFEIAGALTAGTPNK